MIEIIELNEFDPETWAQCPVCGQQFEQKREGRERIYCSAVCRLREFRFKKMKRNYTNEERTTLVQQQMAVGDWRFHSLPEWLHYTCLGCGAAVGSGLRQAQPGWYDWRDFDSLRGVYRRVVCGGCCKQLTIKN